MTVKGDVASHKSDPIVAPTSQEKKEQGKHSTRLISDRLVLCVRRRGATTTFTRTRLRLAFPTNDHHVLM